MKDSLWNTINNVVKSNQVVLVDSGTPKIRRCGPWVQGAHCLVQSCYRTTWEVPWGRWIMISWEHDSARGGSGWVGGPLGWMLKGWIGIRQWKGKQGDGQGHSSGSRNRRKEPEGATGNKDLSCPSLAGSPLPRSAGHILMEGGTSKPTCPHSSHTPN